MADSEDLSTISAEEDTNYGFKRNEMYSSNLAGTVDPYDRHVFLCFKSPDAWASRVEEDFLPKLLSSAVKARKGDITVKVRRFGLFTYGAIKVLSEVRGWIGELMVVVFLCLVLIDEINGVRGR